MQKSKFITASIILALSTIFIYMACAGSNIAVKFIFAVANGIFLTAIKGTYLLSQSPLAIGLFLFAAFLFITLVDNKNEKV